MSAAGSLLAPTLGPTGGRSVSALPLDFDAVYDGYFGFVWRSLRRLGMPAARLDDAVQDVFLVVHRRLSDFEQRSTPKTWLYGIVLRVTQDHRRTIRRKDRVTDASPPEVLEELPDRANPGPFERAETSESIATLNELLSEITESKREVFVLAELEQMTGPEIAEALGIELTTVHSRLRAARMEFEQALARRRAREREGPHGAE
jgi:RNA polymerase sigma-70 factor (ECF subfamily)